MKQRYAKGNIFTDVKLERFPRHNFDKSFITRLTCNHGLAIPILAKQVVPGDRIDISTFGRVQLMPLATSSMQNLRCYIRYFYVPHRLVWENWDKFMTQDSLDETAIDAPYTILDAEKLNLLAERNFGDLADMLGLGIANVIRLDGANAVRPYARDAKLQFNLYRWASYHLIWDYYFRDENLQEPIFEPLQDGYNDYSVAKLTTLLPVAWEKDYFTTALPWAQKGEPVNLSAYITATTLTDFQNYDLGQVRAFYDNDGVATGANFVTNTNGQLATNPAVANHRIEFGLESLDIPGNQLSTSLNINDLRYSNALQRFLERKALGGSRPAEFYLSMYGVRVDDLRIGQPLYLGGGYSNVSVTDVKQQSESTADSPLGTLGGDGKSFPAMEMNNPYYCQEFGTVMAIMYIRPEINYSQGLPREMQLFSTLDYYNPIFAHLGEEEVKTSELYLKDDIDNTTLETNNDSTFGFQSRYAYLKHNRNEIHGDLKKGLSNWVLGTMFENEPALNSEFITVAQNYDIFAIDRSTEHHYLCEFFHKFECESSMPTYAIPSL